MAGNSELMDVVRNNVDNHHAKISDALYEKWIELTNGVDANTASADIVDTWVDIQVTQLDKFGGAGAADGKLSELRKYNLISAFPVSVSQVSLAYDNNDSYEEFDVEFAYQYHTTEGGDNKNNVV